jgi:hypothetical protein
VRHPRSNKAAEYRQGLCRKRFVSEFQVNLSEL